MPWKYWTKSGRKKDEAIASQQYEVAAELRDRELNLNQDLDTLKEEWQEDRSKGRTTVTEEDIAEVVSMWTGIPVTRLAAEETERLIHMEEDLHKRIIGQDEAIVNISKAVRRARAGLKDPRHPIGVFMFLGPTGVGKTELVRAMAEVMFGHEDNMIRLDMSEFQERHTTARLIGAPPGYVGYDEGGQLTEGVRRKNYCAILLDEIEKAHPEVFNILLQIFDAGQLTDARGRRVDFRNSIIVMTSNLGSDLIKRDTSLGFGVKSENAQSSQQSYERMKGQGNGRGQALLPSRVPESYRCHGGLPPVRPGSDTLHCRPDDQTGAAGTGRQEHHSGNHRRGPCAPW
ncbi:Chaperone protein ClpB [Geodia barretti]|uniref:Chaperone protein ClpB n=1 Tax=Geodia barretti TaxID=519541 RepID=A0AA35X922_GEOBA|nr:Chaperone protein ClpB [Geodia barretti]